MDLGLSGKNVLITGSSRGIGRATAIAFAKEGARVVLSSRGGEDLDAALAAVKLHGEAASVVGDLSTRAGCDAIVDGAAKAFGGLDILVNNVGGSGARTFDESDVLDFQAGLDRNLWPAYHCSRAVVSHLRARSGGVIAMVSSIYGRESGGAIAYNVAKAADIALAKAMARDLAKDAIRVFSIAPGSILFEGGGWDRRQKANPDKIAEFVAQELPFGRFGRAEEVAEVIAFLCSARASWVAGACVPIDGAQGRAF